ncbi:hypothetical protein SAMD00019534_068100, partial [Acytostelium subglobosum LB1]|uniref:hypothetical protein n=1 Tax=Acytostelium subglobosum LB1 TaxID=1410327 RepID=UPI000644F03E
MTYINDFDEFYNRAETLYRSDPSRTRYSFKFRHVDSKIVLKVTNDRQTLVYHTDKENDLKRIDTLNNLFFQLTTSQ